MPTFYFRGTCNDFSVFVSAAAPVSSPASSSTDIVSQIGKLKAREQDLQKQLEAAKNPTGGATAESEEAAKKIEETITQVQQQIAELTARLAGEKTSKAGAAAPADSTDASQQANPYSILMKADLSTLSEIA